MRVFFSEFPSEGKKRGRQLKLLHQWPFLSVFMKASWDPELARNLSYEALTLVINGLTNFSILVITGNWKTLKRLTFIKWVFKAQKMFMEPFVQWLGFNRSTSDVTSFVPGYFPIRSWHFFASNSHIIVHFYPRFTSQMARLGTFSNPLMPRLGFEPTSAELRRPGTFRRMVYQLP